MAISERFGVGQDIILGVQGESSRDFVDSVNIAAIVLPFVDTVGAVNGNGSRIITPGSATTAPNTCFVQYDVTFTGSFSALSWTVKRTHNAVPVTINTGTGAELNQTDTRVYDDTTGEGISIEVTVTDPVSFTLTMTFDTYTITYVPDVVITGVAIGRSTFNPEKSALVALTFNGQTYQLRLEFDDETLTTNTITGGKKRKQNG